MTHTTDCQLTTPADARRRDWDREGDIRGAAEPRGERRRRLPGRGQGAGRGRAHGEAGQGGGRALQHPAGGGGQQSDLFQITHGHDAQVRSLVQFTLDKFGKLDFLVNNGGGQFPCGAADMSLKGWSAVVETNLTGTWLMCRSAAAACFR